MRCLIGRSRAKLHNFATCQMTPSKNIIQMIIILYNICSYEKITLILQRTTYHKLKYEKITGFFLCHCFIDNDL